MVSKKGFSHYLLSAVMLLISILILLPVILAFLTSLKTMTEIQSPAMKLLPETPVWRNYADAMLEGNWGRYLFNTMYITFFSIVISLLINSLTGYSLARLNYRYKNALFIMILVGMMVPPQVTMIPMVTMLKNVPFMGGNNWMGKGGMGLIDTYAGLIIPQIAGSFGVFLCRQFYLSFPKELDEAAKIDGCSRLGAYCRIYLPMSGPIFATLAIIKGTGAWNEYLWPLIITNTDKMKTVQIALATFNRGTGMVWNQMMAATIVISLPLIILFIIAQKYFVEGIATSGIKG